jgi:hypothetical protein
MYLLRRKTVIKNIIFIVVIVLATLFAGCTESERPVYGQGNPPAEYQEVFGNENGARLDFVQNRAISELSARIGRLEGGDPND